MKLQSVAAIKRLYAPVLLAALLAVAPPATAAPKPQVVPDFKLRDFRGKSWSLNEFLGGKLVVVVFIGTECPLARLYAKQLAELSATYASRDVAFLAIDSNQQDSPSEMAHFAQAHKIEFAFLKDAGNVVADQFSASRTPEVFVLDAHRQVRYHGRIDDQFTYGIQRATATKQYLTDALDELLSGKNVTIAETEPVGCLIGKVLEPQHDSEVTYANQISRILQARCVECHRPGQIAPLSLTGYDEAAGWAEMIQEVVQQQRMPPWHANPQYGKFANDNRLSADEKRLIDAWVRAGAPEGNPDELPPPREFSDAWRIGKPDAVYSMPQPFQVPAQGEVRYQYFVVDPGFTEDKWVRAAECRPGNPSVVHHIIVGVRPPGIGGRGRSVHGLKSQWLAATAPGARPLELRDGFAKLVPAGSKFVFQMHYTPNGEPQEDRSSVGLVFADPATVRKEVVTQAAANRSFRIPPGASDHRVESTFRFRQDSLLLALFPHMHLRGKSFRYTAVYPDGGEAVLLDIPGYDFNWQNSYAFAEPLRVPAGTVLRCEAHFDNSEDNLANPDPGVEVRWGDQTWEEMMIGYFDMALADQDLIRQGAAAASSGLKSP